MSDSFIPKLATRRWTVTGIIIIIIIIIITS